MRAALRLGLLASMLLAGAALAEQFKQFGAWRVHYIAFNAWALSPQVAERYDLVRGRNKGLLNISAIGPSGSGEKAKVSGHFVNLLGQTVKLDFREIDDRGAVYYLAAFDFDHAEALRFEVNLELPGHGAATIEFQQALYFPDR